MPLRGALVGFGVVLALSVAWALYVLVTAWAAGDFDRAFPNCDPCGFIGYAGRMAIVTAIFLGTAGVTAAIAGAVAGWIVQRVRRPAAR
jgi:hypothetical protein